MFTLRHANWTISQHVRFRVTTTLENDAPLIPNPENHSLPGIAEVRRTRSENTAIFCISIPKFIPAVGWLRNFLVPRFFPFRIPPCFSPIDAFMLSPSGPGEIFPEDVNSLRKAAQTSTSITSLLFVEMWKAKNCSLCHVGCHRKNSG